MTLVTFRHTALIAWFLSKRVEHRTHSDIPLWLKRQRIANTSFCPKGLNCHRVLLQMENNTKALRHLQKRQCSFSVCFDLTTAATLSFKFGNLDQPLFTVSLPGSTLCTQRFPFSRPLRNSMEDLFHLIRWRALGGREEENYLPRLNIEC